MSTSNRLLRPREAAEYLRMSTDQLAQMRYRGRGPAYLKPSSRTVLYRQTALDEWLATTERTTTASVA